MRLLAEEKEEKPLFGFVPYLELLVKALNEVVGDVIVETFHADVLNPMQRLDRHLIGEVTVITMARGEAKSFTASSMVKA